MMFAQASNGTLCHIYDAKNGLRCDCVCLECGESLIAKQSQWQSFYPHLNKKQEWHFAHARANTCNPSPETILHKVAKHLVSKRAKDTGIYMPAVILDLNVDGEFFVVKKAFKQVFDESAIEKQDNSTGLRPDVSLKMGSKNLWIEIYVTHAVEAHKLNAIKQHNISVIEIDLRSIDVTSNYIKALNDIVVENSDTKKWLHNAWLDNRRREFTQISEWKHKPESSPDKIKMYRYFQVNDEQYKINIHEVQSYNENLHHWHVVLMKPGTKYIPKTGNTIPDAGRIAIRNVSTYEDAMEIAFALACKHTSLLE